MLPLSADYGRHLVLGVEREGREVRLSLQPLNQRRGQSLSGVSLRDSWVNTEVREGDIVHVELQVRR